MSVDTKHYDRFAALLNEKEADTRVIRLDPYRVSKVWGVGSVDPSGALFHILKNIARYRCKEGNTGARERAGILASIVRLIELEDGEDVAVELLSNTVHRIKN